MINERQSYSNDRAVEIKTIGHFECQKNPTKVEFSLMKALRILTECSEKYFFPAIFLRCLATKARYETSQGFTVGLLVGDPINLHNCL